LERPQGASEVEVAFGNGFDAFGGDLHRRGDHLAGDWAHAASAPRRRSPEQAAMPEPPAPAWASASYECPPMFTEQAIGVPDSLAFASSVILEEPGSLRYFSFRGFWISRRSVLMLPTFAVNDLSYQIYRPCGARPKLMPLGGFAEGEPEKVSLIGIEV
jgi:hypothetical protein